MTTLLWACSQWGGLSFPLLSSASPVVLACSFETFSCSWYIIRTIGVRQRQVIVSERLYFQECCTRKPSYAARQVRCTYKHFLHHGITRFLVGNSVQHMGLDLLCELAELTVNQTRPLPSNWCLCQDNKNVRRSATRKLTR